MVLYCILYTNNKYEIVKSILSLVLITALKRTQCLAHLTQSVMWATVITLHQLWAWSESKFLADWHKSQWVDRSFHSDTLSWFWAKQSLVLLIHYAPSGKAANTTFIVFGFTQPGHEPNQGEQANHYTIDAVCRKSKMTTIARQNFYLYPIWEIEGEKNQKFRNLIEPKQGMNIYWMIPCKFCFCLDRKSKMSIITGQIKYRTIWGNILKLLWSEPNEQFGGKFGCMPCIDFFKMHVFWGCFSEIRDGHHHKA